MDRPNGFLITQSGRTFLYQPPVNANFTQPSASALNRQKDIREIQRNIVADSRVVPLVYGHAQVGGHPFAIDYDGGTFTVGYVVCVGEIESFVKVLADGDTLPDGVTLNTYTGTSAQTADPLLTAAIADYEDELNNIAYLVIQYTDQFDTWPQIVAEVEGKKVYNPKTGTTVYSANPSLHLGDLLSSATYGGGWTVDATALEAAQDANDDTAGISEPRRQSFSVLDEPRSTEDWAEVLRAYAGVFLVWRGSTVFLIPDKVKAVSATFTESDIIDGSLKIRKKSSRDLPTVIQVRYTDKSQSEWRERRSDEAVLAGDRRVSVVSLPGITRHSQAYREAVERLNKLSLSDLEVSFATFDEGLNVELGDVIEVSHPYGLTEKQMRVIQIKQVDIGRWSIVGQEYDAAAYSDSVIDQPSTPDTRYPTNGPPDPVPSITLAESTYQLQNGKYASRIDISWEKSPSPYVNGYSVRVFSGAEVVWGGVVDSLSVSTSPLKEIVPYTVEVRPQTALFVGGSVTENITIIGKTAIPDAPSSLNGFEAGGEVRLNWPASTDVDAERYEIRYGITGGSWATATQLDIVDGLRLVTKDVPEGTWRFYVRTIDSIEQLSNDQATLDLTVTLDNDAFTAASLSPLGGDVADMTNMHESVESRLSEFSTFYADSGESWSDLFGASAMNTFTSALASYQNLPADSVYISPEIDLLEDKSGNFRAAVDIDDYGTADQELGIQPDGGSYDYTAQLSRQQTARKTRVRVTGSDPFAVRGAGGFHRIDVVATEETGSDTSLSSGGKKITLSKRYAAARSIVITPSGSSARTASYDNVVLNDGGVTSFEVYIFNSSGAQIASDFLYQWKGV